MADSGQREVPTEVRAIYAIRRAETRAERAEGLLAEALWALDNLVKLKDGPRDEVYEREKSLAWQDARRVLSRAEGERS